MLFLFVYGSVYGPVNRAACCHNLNVMATLAIGLNTTYKLDNNEHSVALRITQDRKPKYFSIGSLISNNSLSFQCRKENWRSADKEDNGLGRFRKSIDRYKELNEILEAKLKRAQDILNGYDKVSIPFSFERFEQDLKETYLINARAERTAKQVIEEPATPTVTLHEYYSEQIKILDEQQRASMAGLCLENQRILHKCMPNALLTDVNFRFFGTFEYWMRNVRGNEDTTIGVKMRNIQRIINLKTNPSITKYFVS